MPLPVQLPSELSHPRTWTEAAEYASSDVELAEAIAFFKGFLGEGWKGWRERHHFARSFHTAMQGGPREWVRMHRLAMVFDRTPGLDAVVKALGMATWKDHVAAAQTLELCGRLRKAGHRVELIQNTHMLSPDTRVWLQNRPVTIEFKALHDQDGRSYWDAFEKEVTRELVTQLHQRDAWPPDHFKLRVEIKKPEIQSATVVADALLRILDSRDEAWRDLPDGTGRARFTEDLRERGWHPPIQQHDDLTRLVRNLVPKGIKQLRTVDGPTLLVVLTARMFPMEEPESLRAKLGEVTTKLREVLRGRKMLGGLLLHEEPLRPPHEPVHRCEPDWRFAIGETEGRARAVLLMLNPLARAPLVPDEIEPLAGPDMRW